MKEWPTRSRIGTAARLADLLGHDAARPEIVDDRRPRMAPQLRAREEDRDQVAADPDAAGSEEHAAVAVAVEGDAEIGAGLLHRLLEVVDVLVLERVGLMAREAAVGLPAEADEVDRQVAEDRVEMGADRAVGEVDGDLQLRRLLDLFAEMGAVVGLDAARRDLRAALRLLGREPLDLLQPRLLADGEGLLAADLEARCPRADCATRSP
jgi:hypothetical protein